MRNRKSTACGFGRGAALVLSAALFAAGCGVEKTARTDAPEVVQGLRVETAKLRVVPALLEAPGTVVSSATAEIAARTTGTVLGVTVKEGDPVRQGELLAQIDDQELVARRSAAQAGLQQATAGIVEATRGLNVAQAQADIASKTFHRYTYLQEQKSVSQQEFDEVSAKNLAAQAGLEQAQARLQQAEAAKMRAESDARAAGEIANYARIRAPFGGRVVRRLVEPGTMVMPGMQLFVLERSGAYQLDATLPAEALATVRRGAAAEVRFDALPEKVFSGKVAEMEAGADAATHTVSVRIGLPRDAAIQSGMFGRAMFRRGEKKAVVVKSAAVVERGQLRGLFVVNGNGLTEWRVVTTGPANGGETEILSGLADGERYVADPGERELDGKRLLGETEKRS